MKLNGGLTSQSFKGTYKTNEVITLINPTKLGYTFTGWSVTSGNSTISGNKLTMGSQNTIITANWKGNTYIMTFDSNGGTNVENKTITYGSAYGTLPTPTRAGYEFLGWYTLNYKDYPLNYYADNYADLKNAFGYNADLLYEHWKNYGKSEGRRVSQFLSKDMVSAATNITVYAGWRANTSVPVFTYTGSCEIVDDSDNVISNTSTCGKSISSTQSTWTGNWKIRFLTSGTLTFTTLNGASNGIDVFLVGGGGAGGNAYGGYGSEGYFGSGGGGGAGGYTATLYNKKIHEDSYEIIIGNGAKSSGQSGGASTAFGISVLGGSGGASATSSNYTAVGGFGGSNGGTGGRYAAAGTSPGYDGNSGQGISTREFGEIEGKYYAGGGAGGTGHNGYSGTSSIVSGGYGGGGASSTNAEPNTGGGGGGGSYYGGTTTSLGKTGKAGGSGIVIIRNTRIPDYTKNNNIPSFSYTGLFEVVNDNDENISTTEKNWKIRFLTSGILTINSFNNSSDKIDVFLVGGGGAGGKSYGAFGSEGFFGSGGGGGAGGYTATYKGVSFGLNTYEIVVGSGGTAQNINGGTTSAFGFNAEGGKGGSSAAKANYSASGGIGGSNGGTGGNYANRGSNPGYNGSPGQGTTTQEFGDNNNKFYAGGGAGGQGYNGYVGGSPFVSGAIGGGGGSYSMGATNSGGGGGGASSYYAGPKSPSGAAGGSGIVIIRNAR